VLLQLIVLGCGWGLNFTPFALAFPFVIAGLVPIHAYVLPILFTSKQLIVLEGNTEEAGGFSGAEEEKFWRCYMSMEDEEQEEENNADSSAKKTGNGLEPLIRVAA